MIKANFYNGRTDSVEVALNLKNDFADIDVLYLYTAAEVGALYLSSVDGQGRVLAHEAGDDVGAARDGGQQHVRLNLP